MSLTIKIGATTTGGTDLTFVDQGSGNANQRVYMDPTSTLQEPRLLKVTAITPKTTATNPGRGKSELLFVFAKRTESEGCCSVKAGTVTFRLTVDWPLDQPVELVEDGIEWLQGISFSSYLSDLIKKGVVAA